MKTYLVKFDGNYADEFDVSGFDIWDEDYVDHFKGVVTKYFETHSNLEIYFGTNEFMEWCSSADVLRDLTFVEITDEEANVLHKLFGMSWERPGYFPDFLDFMDEENED